MVTEGTRRFLIVAGCYADADPAIRLAEALAQARQSARMGALAGVMVRETVCEAVEGAPLLSWNRLRPRSEAVVVTREGLTAAYAADARAFSNRLSLTATRARLTWTFHTDQGATADVACRLRLPGDTLFLGVRRLLDTGGPVVALCQSDDFHTQTFAATLARTLNCRTLALPIEGEDAPKQIDEMSVNALIVAPGLIRQPARLSALIEAARCPVLVVPDAV